jgi:predicted anti-sigma-YlaC factor YlaD
MKEKQEEEHVLCSQPELAYLFPFYINGDGESDERQRIEEHLADCAVCREDMKFFSDLQRVGEELFGDE